MTVSTFVPMLALFTLLAVTIYALISKRRVEQRRADQRVHKSTLAEDAPNHDPNRPDAPDRG